MVQLNEHGYQYIRHWRNGCYRSTRCECLYPPLQSHLCNPFPTNHTRTLRLIVRPLSPCRSAAQLYQPFSKFHAKQFHLSVEDSPDYAIAKLARVRAYHSVCFHFPAHFFGVDVLLHSLYRGRSISVTITNCYSLDTQKATDPGTL